MWKLAIAFLAAAVGCAGTGLEVPAPYYVAQTYRTPQAELEVRYSFDRDGNPTDACTYVDAATGRDANAIPPDSEDEVTPGALERLKP